MSDSSDHKEKELEGSDSIVAQPNVPMDIDLEPKAPEVVTTSMQIDQEEPLKVTYPEKFIDTPEDAEIPLKSVESDSVGALSSRDGTKSITSAGKERKSSLSESRLQLAVNILEDLVSKRRAALGTIRDEQKMHITIPKIKTDDGDCDSDEMNVDSDIPEDLSAPEDVAEPLENRATVEDPARISTESLMGPAAAIPTENTGKEKFDQPETSDKELADGRAQTSSHRGARPKVFPLKKNLNEKRKGISKRRLAVDEGLNPHLDAIDEEVLKARREEWSDVTEDIPKPEPPPEGSAIQILRKFSQTLTRLEFQRRRQYGREDSSAWQTLPLAEYHEPRPGFILDKEPPELTFDDDYQVSGVEESAEPSQGADAESERDVDRQDPEPGSKTRETNVDNPDGKPGSSTEPIPSSESHGGGSSEGQSPRGFLARVFRPLMGRQQEERADRRSRSPRSGTGSHQHAADEQPIFDEAVVPVEEEIPRYMLMPFDMGVPEPIRRDLEPHRLLAAIDRYAHVLRNPIGAWRTLMRVAYGTGRYHTRVTLRYARESLRAVDVSEEEFHTLFHEVYMQIRQPDEGIEEEATELEERIRDCIIANGEVTFAMLYADIENQKERERMQAVVIRQREERRRALEAQTLDQQRLQQAPSNDSDNDTSSVSDPKTNTNTDRVQNDEPEKPSKLPFGVLKGYVNLKLEDSSSANLPDTPPEIKKPPKVLSFDKSSEESQVSSPVGIASPDPEGSDEQVAHEGLKSHSQSPVDVLFPKEKLLEEQKLRREQGNKSYSSSGEECNMCDDSTMGSVSPIPPDFEMPEETAIPEAEQVAVVNHVLISDILAILSSKEFSDEKGDDEEAEKEAASPTGKSKVLQEEGTDSEMEHLLTSSVAEDDDSHQAANESKLGADSSKSSPSEGSLEKEQMKRKDRFDPDDSNEKDSKRRHL